VEGGGGSTSRKACLKCQKNMTYIDEEGVPVTVYTPNDRRGGLVWGIKQATSDIFASRHVIGKLFWRDFIAQFRQKVLGYFWAVLSPLVGIASFLFLYLIGVLQPGEGRIPYTLYALIGSTIWGCLPGAVGAVSGGLQAQADLIMRTRVPKLALAVASLANLAYGIGISMITMTVIFMVMGYTPSPWFLAYPLLVVPMVALGMAIGLVLSVLGVIARDLVPMATQALGLVMYITPVIYVRSSLGNPIVLVLIDFNPLTYLVDVPRSLVCLGHADNLAAFVWIALGALALVVIGLRVFYLLEDLVAERL
jgi:lipopolysaccharide transport system permease protein